MGTNTCLLQGVSVAARVRIGIGRQHTIRHLVRPLRVAHGDAAAVLDAVGRQSLKEVLGLLQCADGVALVPDADVVLVTGYLLASQDHRVVVKTLNDSSQSGEGPSRVVAMVRSVLVDAAVADGR